MDTTRQPEIDQFGNSPVTVKDTLALSEVGGNALMVGRPEIDLFTYH